MNFHKLKHDTEILFRPEEIEVSSHSLEPGVWALNDRSTMMNQKITFSPLAANNLIAFSDGVIKTFLKEVDFFFNPKTAEIYQGLKMKHSTGYIIYGKPGTGKTCLCLLAMSELAKKYGAVCLDMTRVTIMMAKHMVSVIRKIQPNPIVLFADECDVDFRESEAAFLPFLDGSESIEDLIFLGCTNRIDQIPERIKHRKSRIKRCFEIKNLPLKVYQEYLQERLPDLNKDAFSEICYKAMDSSLTIDQFKNALLDFRLHDIPISAAIKNAIETYKDDVPGDADEDEDDK